MEEVGEKFNTKTYFQVREQTKKILLDLKNQIHPGMKEHQAHKIFNEILKFTWILLNFFLISC